MLATSGNTTLVKNTSHTVVIPFYLYAALSFLTATVLLFFSPDAFTTHYFHPHTLAITHTMALGWGTMIILGASHQLVPVLIEGRLYSNTLGYLSFVFGAIGIPLLVYSFFYFEFQWPALTGAILINAAILSYLVNLAISIVQSKTENVHAIFVFTAAIWLFITTMIGLLLVWNFTDSILANDSLHYLSLHAHIGIVGWFIMLVIGVGSRLIPMFLISKYSNNKRLWTIFFLLNGSLLSFIVSFLFSASSILYLIPIAAMLTALVLFFLYCRKSYQERIRKQVDEQMKISLLSIVMILLPIILLTVLVGSLFVSADNSNLVLAYGFSVFFGWLTAIIFGMTFKTLPFIVWNKIYHDKAGLDKTPNPNDLFSKKIFDIMGLGYLVGFSLFVAGILGNNTIVLQSATILLLATAVLYSWNVMKVLLHKPLVR